MDHAREKGLFRPSRAQEKAVKEFTLLAIRAAPRGTRQRVKHAVDFADLQARLTGRRSLGVTQGGIANANPALSRAPREVGGNRLDFLYGRLPQQRCEQVDFFEAPGRFRYQPGSLYQLRELHRARP